jgi:hypothetical protein
MKTIPVDFKSLDLKEYRNRSATEKDYDFLVDEDAIITLNGKKIIVYIARLEQKMPRMVEALKKVKYDTSTRTNGLVTTSKIFGFAPRNVIRNHPCRSAKFASDQPQEHDIVARAAYIAEEQYKKHHPEMAEKHFQIADQKVKREYRIGETMFTSGIINHNNPLRYHFDAGNFEGVASAMFAFKEDIEGGFLSVPEVGLGFACKDHSLTIFDGQALLHGVTPIKKLKQSATRFTVVFYSLKQLWNCETNVDEISRLRARRAEYEFRKAGINKETIGIQKNEIPQKSTTT